MLDMKAILIDAFYLSFAMCLILPYLENNFLCPPIKKASAKFLVILIRSALKILIYCNYKHLNIHIQQRQKTSILIMCNLIPSQSCELWWLKQKAKNIIKLGSKALNFYFVECEFFVTCASFITVENNVYATAVMACSRNINME